MRTAWPIGTLICTLLTSGGMAAPVIRFAPSKIQPNDGYILHINVPDGTRLDYDLRLAPLNLASVTHSQGPWADFVVSGGKVEVPAGQQFGTGIYLVRFKVRNAPASEYSNFDALMVDPLPTMNPNVTYSTVPINLPPPGSYMLFENRNGAGQFAGYSRIDIETDTCELGGYTMRFTKTRQSAYWNAGGVSFLRWCVIHEPTTDGRFLLSPGGTMYGSPQTMSQLAGGIKVSYGNSWQDGSAQGLLGGFPRDISYLDYYTKDADLGIHYSLLPPGDLIPAGISATPITICELAFGHPLQHQDIGLDLWHTEVLPANAPGGAMRMRYVETGARIEEAAIQIRWSVTEDWVWRTDGLLSRITQWTNMAPLCWRAPYRCETAGPLLVDTTLIDWWIPDNNPLQIRLRDLQTGQLVEHLHILKGQSYELVATRFDGQPYSGFLELQLGFGVKTLWRDAENKPIYVSGGSVIVGPPAYGGLTHHAVNFAARPYLTNSSLNALYPVTDGQLIPNASTAAYSNSVHFVMSELWPDFDGDADVDQEDFGHFQLCITGPQLGPPATHCRDADLDGDNDVDLADFGLFQRCLSGPDIPATPGCDR